MLRLFRRLSLAHFRSHRVRVSLTGGGVAVGVASVITVLALSRSIVQSYQDSVTVGAGAAQLQITNGTAGLDRDLIEDVSAIQGVRATGATVQLNILVPELDRRLTVFGVELGRDEAYREVQTGPDVAHLPDVITFIAQTDSIALSAETLRRQGWRLGHALEVRGPKGPHTLTVRGTLYPKGPFHAFGSDVALMDLDAAQLRFGDPTRVHWIDVVVGSNAEIPRVKSDIEGLLNGRGVVASPLARGQRIEGMLSLLRTLLTGTSVVAMLVAAFLIHHTLSTSYRQRRDDFVRLRSLGVTRGRLAAYLVGEAAFLGLVSSIAGVVLGAGLWFLATRNFTATVATLFLPLPAPAFALSIGEILGATLFGTLVVVGGAVLPLLGMLRGRPLDLEQRGDSGTRARSVMLAIAGAALLFLGVQVAPWVRDAAFSTQILLIGIMAAFFFLGVPLVVPLVLRVGQRLLAGNPRRLGGLLARWAWSQVWRQRVHTATTMGALAAGVAFAIALTMLLGSYRAAFRGWFDQTFVGDVLVNAGPTISLLGGQTVEAQLGDDIAGIEGVDHVLRWRFMEVQFQEQPIVVQAMSEELLAHLNGGVVSDDELLISDTLAERFSLAAGDTIVIPAPRQELRAKVAAVVPDYVLHLGTVKIGWRAFQEHFADDRVSLYLVAARPGTSPTDLRQRIDAAVRDRFDVTVLTAEETRSAVDHLVDQSVGLTYWLQALATLVAVAAIINATTASIVDRARELETWHALGLTRTRLIRLLAAEAAFVGGMGSLLGAGTGVLLGWCLTSPIARGVAGFRLAIAWPVGMLLTVPFLCIAASGLAAGLVSRRRLARLD